MSRREEAEKVLASWDPDGDEVLPDWVADVLDDDPALAQGIEARFPKWGGGPARTAAPAGSRRRWGLPAGITALAAAALAAVGLATLSLEQRAPVERLTPDRPLDQGTEHLDANRIATNKVVAVDGTTIEAKGTATLAGDDLDGFFDMPPAGHRAGGEGLEGERRGEGYDDPGTNGFVATDADPWSTFAIDVDTASYSLARRKLREGYLPVPAGIRVEEFVNFFHYTYGPPPEGAPFGVAVEGVPSPFAPTTLVRIGVQGKRLWSDQRPDVHLTFLVDTSGSMSSADKLGLVKSSLTGLVGELEDGDTVAIVAYAGSAGLVLPPTSMGDRQAVLDAVRALEAGGSTAMGQGIALAYAQAQRAFRPGAVNRVVLLSDGDANVGVTDPAALSEMIRTYADAGITLTTAGFGTGNFQDATMERLADEGDGNYYYIDDEAQARRVFVDTLTSTLVVIARDVKIQVEWDPSSVRRYRLLGYENRDVADRDFRNDAVDAGEIGAGHQVTALYELELAPGRHDHLGTVRIRNEAPEPGAPAVERRYDIAGSAVRPTFASGSADTRLAVGAATFAEVLRRSPHVEQVGYAAVERVVRDAVRPDYPEDSELLALVTRAAALDAGR